MPCYRPLQAYQCLDGGVVFQERSRHDTVRSLLLSCGQCIGCRLERSRQWAVRCMHEASLYDKNSYITLTYADEHLRVGGSLVYRDFQLFMKRLRKRCVPEKLSFYMAGEYGEVCKMCGRVREKCQCVAYVRGLGRSHFHACVFNCGFDDMVYFKMSPGGGKLYRSKVLEALWPYGYSTIGAVTFESAAYVARYCMKKVTGADAAGYYTDVDGLTGEIFERVPEFNRMSLKPGIGRNWLRLYWAEVLQKGEVVMNGKVMPAPKAYLRYLKRMRKFEDVQLARDVAARASFAERSDARLVVREKVAEARVKLLKRVL